MRRDPATRAPDFWATARDFLHSYLPAVRKASPNTVEAYRISLECYIGYLTSQGIARDRIGFDHFNRAHLRTWVAWMNTDKGYAPRTVTLRLTSIRAFLAYAGAEDITLMALRQSATTVKLPTVPRTPIEHLDQDQTRALLAAHTGRTAKSRRNRMILILLYDTAARVGELTSLTVGSLQLVEPAHITLTGKRDKTRVVPLTKGTVEHLRVYLNEFHPDHTHQPADRPLFYSLRQGQPQRLSTDTIASVFTAAADIARPSCPTLPDSVHCHLLRKTKAMDLHQQGVPLPIIMRLLGHENMTTTNAFYAFATIDMMRAAINAATPVTNTPVNPLTEDTIQALHTLR